MCYYSFSSYLKEKYGTKVRRISLNAGFSCPNVDPARGRGGCIFCNEFGFSRFAGSDATLREQIESSMADAGKKSGIRKFIAYFQNATNTNASVRELRTTYDAIREYPEIVALFISTRPDCVDDKKLDLIAGYTGDYELWVEYGLQTVRDRTLKALKRGHTFRQAAEAIEMTAKKGIRVGAHVILGLPGETAEDMIATAREISRLPVSGVKLHVLHVLRDTELEEMYLRREVALMGRGEYVSAVCDFLENLKPDRVVLRLVSDARKEFLVAPEWINDKLSVIDEIRAEFAARGTRQGSACRGQ